MTVNGAAPIKIRAQHAVLGKSPREIVLQQPDADSGRQQGHADEATLFLRDDNSLDHAVAVGNVAINSLGRRTLKSARSDVGAKAATISHVTSQKLELAMRPHNQFNTAVFTGDVRFRTDSPQPTESSAQKAILSFKGRNILTRIHAEQQVKLLQHQLSGSNQQDVAVAAPVLDMFVADGNRLTQAYTTGPPEITISPEEGKSGAQTRITADKFVARFDSLGQISQVHGDQHARVVTTEPPRNNVQQLDRVSTSDSIDAYFRPGTGIETLLQTGHFTYQAGTEQAFAERARYTPADQILLLTGAPRVLDTGMATTGRTVRLNRATGDGFAEGGVKTTYSDLKAQPNGALLASSDPIHVTAQTMTAHNSPSTAIYKGNARLWQDANMVEAPTIQFQKDQRTVIADSNAEQKVSTSLTSTDKRGKSTAVHVTSDHLTYRDAERQAHYEGDVIARDPDYTVTSDQMDVFFAPATQNVAPKTVPLASSLPATARQPASSETPAKVEKIIASGAVVITQPSRRGTGDKLTYLSEDDKFILTGGPPSIFDAERGKITGVSLTLFRRDDRVIVDGNSSLPAVTNTRVVR